ncbi:AhpC/TSA family protein [Pontibacter sp. JH31]|uniref:AhpC/TSA family protein n=2 Tax=Pontibacter aquaedesilientis TaxID=2766980 RepID=A0ABR7XGI8_9BACT|nr:AhpC/TSA family protein [Pontibacter aquaedesilientis]
MLLLSLALMLTVYPSFAQNKVVLKGKIQKNLTEEVTLASLPSPLHPEERQTVARLEKGEFVLEMSLTEAGIVEFIHGGESVPLYLEPGYEMSLSFTAGKMLKTLKFTGSGANENSYLTLHSLHFDEEEDYQTLPDNIKLPESEFLKFLAYRKEDQLNTFKAQTAKYPVNENFRKLIMAEIEYSYANDRLTFYDLRNRVILNNKLTPSASYYSFLTKLDMKQPASLQCISFPTFLRNYVDFLARQANLIPTDKHYFRKVFDLVGQQLDGEARHMAQAHVIRQSLQQGNVLHVPAMLQDFESNGGAPAVHASLNRKLESYGGLGVGSTAPEFSLKDVRGDTVSLSDFRGKIVYLGFWRTDCGLCLVEQPHAQELFRKLQGYDVVMINIGVEDDEQTWRRAVESRGLSGVQLYLKGQEAELVKQYGLRDVPAYFLIDETGSIISTKPRRPIDREAEKEILQHVMSNRASVK